MNDSYLFPNPTLPWTHHRLHIANDLNLNRYWEYDEVEYVQEDYTYAARNNFAAVVVAEALVAVAVAVAGLVVVATAGAEQKRRMYLNFGNKQ